MSAALLDRAARSLNGLPWKPYTYRGTGQDELTAFMDDDAEPEWPCGTTTGAHRHKDAREPMCQPCRDASNTGRRDQALRQRLESGKPLCPDCTYTLASSTHRSRCRRQA